MLKKSVVIKRKRIKLPRFNYKNLLFFTLFFCGFIVGILSMKGEENQIKSIAIEFFGDYILNKSNDGFFAAFLNSFFLICFFPFITFIFGLCAVGIPIIIAIPTIIGVLVGMAIGFLYSCYSLQGLGYAALILIPSVSIVIATLIRCCNEAVNMSIEIIANMSGYKNQAKRNEFKEYFLRFLIFLVPLIISAIINATSFRVFNNLFSFI